MYVYNVLLLYFKRKFFNNALLKSRRSMKTIYVTNVPETRHTDPCNRDKQNRVIKTATNKYSWLHFVSI